MVLFRLSDLLVHLLLKLHLKDQLVLLDQKQSMQHQMVL
jgi:hypothetical protein